MIRSHSKELWILQERRLAKEPELARFIAGTEADVQQKKTIGFSHMFEMANLLLLGALLRG